MALTITEAGIRAARRSDEADAPRQALACVELLGSSPLVRRTVDLVRRAATERAHVLILAERGLNAEALAREIHDRSPERAAPFLMVDCATADSTALDRLLFGSTAAPRGRAVTDLEPVGADSALVLAASGTLLLTNATELPASAQARLARIARDGEVRLDGSSRARRLDVRLVAVGAPTLPTDVDEGRFRADLFQRLARRRIEVPPLRERPEDVGVIASHLVREICAAAERPAPGFTQVALTLLAGLPWRGNVDELRALLERVVLAHPNGDIRIEDLLTHLKLDGLLGPSAPGGTLREARRRFERDYIVATLQHHRWRMSDAARALGIQRSNLYRKARQLGIPRVRLKE